MLDRLRNLVIGATVEGVDENSESEGMVTLRVRKDGKLLKVPLYATDLGWWVEGETIVDNGISRYLSPEVMLAAMAKVAYSTAEENCESLEDVNRKWIGFRLNGQEFWISIGQCKSSPWTAPLQTPEGRQWIASHQAGPMLWERADPRDGQGIDHIGGPWVDDRR